METTRCNGIHPLEVLTPGELAGRIEQWDPPEDGQATTDLFNIPLCTRTGKLLPNWRHVAMPHPVLELLDGGQEGKLAELLRVMFNAANQPGSDSSAEAELKPGADFAEYFPIVRITVEWPTEQTIENSDETTGLNVDDGNLQLWNG